MTRRGVGSPAKPGESTGSKGSRRREQGRCGERNDASLLEGGLPEVRARSTIFPPFVFWPPPRVPARAADERTRVATDLSRGARAGGVLYAREHDPDALHGVSPSRLPFDSRVPAFPDTRRDGVFFLRKLSPVFPGTCTPRRSRRRARWVRARCRQNIRGAASTGFRTTRFGDILPRSPSWRSADRRFRPTAGLTDFSSSCFPPLTVQPPKSARGIETHWDPPREVRT